MRKFYLPVLLLMLSGVCLLPMGCGSNTAAEQSDGEESLAIPVEITPVIQGDIAAYFSGTAPLEAEEETEVVAKVGGVVETLYVEEGDLIEAGQPLAKLDDEKFIVQVEQAKANLQKLENEYIRSEELYKKNLISAEEFQRAKSEYEYQKASFDLVKLDLHYAVIRAPIRGLVAERMIKVGNMVLANQPTFRVTRPDPLLAILYVPERQIGKLEKGQKASMRIDAIPDGSFTGRVERISPVVDPTTGTVKVTVEIRNPSRRLKPGMFARIDITHDIHANTLLVPKDAVMTEDKASSVFVVEDSTAFHRQVTLGYINTTHVEILSGVRQGDFVVTAGKASLKDSVRVEPVAGSAVELANR